MKTAVSIPDQIFAEAEKLARYKKKSRSQLYAEAVHEYLMRHSPDEITQAMNRVIDDLGHEEEDKVLIDASIRTLEQVEW